MSGTEYGDAMVDELTEEEQKLFESEQYDLNQPPEEEAPPEEDKPEEKPAEEAKSQESTPEQKEQAESEDEDDVPLEGDLNGNKGRFVRHGAFHRQRERAKEFQSKYEETSKELAEYREQMARANERMAVLTQLFEQQQQQPQAPAQQPQGAPQADQQPQQWDQVPDPEQDPFAYMRYLGDRISQLNQVAEQTQQGVQTFEQQALEQQEYTSARTAFMQDAQAFAAKQPDFMDAYQHLMRSRDHELQVIGRQNPQERASIIAQEEFAIVKEAMRQGRSPAELFYALAHDRGYAPPQPEAEQAPAPVEQSAPPAEQPQSNAMDKVRSIAEGQKATKSLSEASGSSGPRVLTAEALANMSEDEFHELYEKMSPSQRRQYFGG